MLHPNAKQRLLRVCPTEFDVGWRHPATGEYLEESVEIDRRFQSQDDPLDYPTVVIEIQQEGIPRWAHGDEMGEEIWKVAHPDDDTVAYDKYTGIPLHAIVNVITAVKSGVKVEPGNPGLGTIPKSVVADSIAYEVFYQYFHNSDHLNEQGTTADGEYVDYEWPMNIENESGEGVTNMNDMTDEQAIQRRVMQMRVNYRFWNEEEVPATDKAGISLGLDKDYDGEADEWLIDSEIFDL